MGPKAYNPARGRIMRQKTNEMADNSIRISGRLGEMTTFKLFSVF